MMTKHPPVLDSGLHCFNIASIPRVLIENHYKRVAHQVECKKFQEEEAVKMTKLLQEIEYRRRLFKMNNFKCRPYTQENGKQNHCVDST